MKVRINYFKFFLGKLLLSSGLLVNKLARVRGRPSKNNKKRSVSVFIFNFSGEGGRRDCIELVKARISSKGDVYIIPNPKTQKENPFHESFHTPKDDKPKEYHIITENDPNDPKISPLYGEKDLPSAVRFSAFARMPACFCFRKGGHLNHKEITILVDRLLRYVPSVNKEEVIFSLETRGICRFRLLNDKVKEVNNRFLEKNT